MISNVELTILIIGVGFSGFMAGSNFIMYLVEKRNGEIEK